MSFGGEVDVMSFECWWPFMTRIMRSERWWTFGRVGRSWLMRDVQCCERSSIALWWMMIVDKWWVLMRGEHWAFTSDGFWSMMKVDELRACMTDDHWELIVDGECWLMRLNVKSNELWALSVNGWWGMMIDEIKEPWGFSVDDWWGLSVDENCEQLGLDMWIDWRIDQTQFLAAMETRLGGRKPGFWSMLLGGPSVDWRWSSCWMIHLSMKLNFAAEVAVNDFPYFGDLLLSLWFWQVGEDS